MKRISEKHYWDMLEVLPPEAMRYSAKKKTEGFLVGEPYDHNAQGVPRYAMYTHVQKGGGRFYSIGYKTMEEFNALMV